MNRKDKIKQLMLLKEKRRREAYDSFWSFCLYMDYPFFNSRKSAIKPIADAFQEIEDDKIDILAISLPPRTGKSYITSMFSAWVLGRNPKESVMRNSYAAKLAEKFSNDIRSIMRSTPYIEVFGEFKFKRDAVNSWELDQSRHGVSYFCAGVGGAITGFGASRYAILDDPIKNEEEALSETILEKKWQWYTSTHRSRMEKGCKEIHIATRWSKNDIIGMLEQNEKFNKDRARVIVVPALITVDGKEESFCEEVQTTEEYLETRRITDDLIWEAEYMQQPIDVKGKLYSGFKTYDKIPTDSNGNLLFNGIYSYCDTADEGSDYLCNIIWGDYNKEAYILDIIYTRDPVEVTEKLVAKSYVEYQVSRARIESNNGGKQFARNVKRILETELNNNFTHVTWFHQSKKKESRIVTWSSWVTQHVYFPSNWRDKWHEFYKGVNSYQRGGKNKHDDHVDTLTGLCETMYMINKR